jgi:hypothetical protein
MTLTQLRQKFDAKKIRPAVEQAFNETSSVYVEFNRQQLREGRNKYGQLFVPYKNELYAEMKNKQNPLPGFGNADYILTGAFSHEIDAVIEGNDIVTTSHDQKTYKIEQREQAGGGDPSLIYGVNDENKALYIQETFKPVLKNILGI